MIVLRQGAWVASINPLGAELRGLDHDGNALLWRGDPAIWGQTAPVLFPFVGRLRQGGYRDGGQWHPMEIHGFASRQRFTLLERSNRHAYLRLAARADRFGCYPFDFVLKLGFCLDAAGLTVSYRVEAGEGGLHFGLGSHPGFALDGALSDWHVEFDEAETGQAYRLQAQEDGGVLLARHPEDLALDEGRRLRLDEGLFDRDALMLKDIKSRCISLVHRERGPHVRLHTGGAPNLGLWSRPAAPYLCIEPWHGLDDDGAAPLELGAKPQLVHLAPNGVFETSYRITR